jgi:hypothetical protein
MMDERNKDQELVRFTDELLSAEDAGSVDISQDPELRSLQETVVLLRQALSDETPDPQMAARIHANLQAHWEDTHSQAQERAEGGIPFWGNFSEFFQSLFRSRQNRTLAYGLAVVLVLLFLWVAFLDEEAGAGLKATAGGVDLLYPLLVTGGLLVVVLLVWLWRSKR